MPGKFEEITKIGLLALIAAYFAQMMGVDNAGPLERGDSSKINLDNLSQGIADKATFMSKGVALSSDGDLRGKGPDENFKALQSFSKEISNHFENHAMPLGLLYAAGFDLKSKDGKKITTESFQSEFAPAIKHLKVKDGKLMIGDEPAEAGDIAFIGNKAVVITANQDGKVSAISVEEKRLLGKRDVPVSKEYSISDNGTQVTFTNNGKAETGTTGVDENKLFELTNPKEYKAIQDAKKAPAPTLSQVQNQDAPQIPKADAAVRISVIGENKSDNLAINIDPKILNGLTGGSRGLTDSPPVYADSGFVPLTRGS